MSEKKAKRWVVCAAIRGRGLEAYARPGAQCKLWEGVKLTAQDALAIALLRHAGFEVLTEQSTEGKM